MAEAIARNDAGDVIEPSSAGLLPLGYVADLTKQTLLKNGYAVRGLTSDALTPEAMEAADIIINMTGLAQARKPISEFSRAFSGVCRCWRAICERSA